MVPNRLVDELVFVDALALRRTAVTPVAGRAVDALVAEVVSVGLAAPVSAVERTVLEHLADGGGVAHAVQAHERAIVHDGDELGPR